MEDEDPWAHCREDVRRYRHIKQGRGSGMWQGLATTSISNWNHPGKVVVVETILDYLANNRESLGHIEHCRVMMALDLYPSTRIFGQ